MKSRWSVLLLLVLLTVTLVGCASTETANESEMPWNTPKSWETGLPASVMEGR